MTRTVLLYSGGMDSYALAAMARPDVLLSVDCGTRYGDAERRRLRIPRGLEGRLEKVPYRDLATFERPDDLILPGRNAHLVLLAAHFGDRILIGATAGDRVKDKDEAFRDHMNALLRHIYSPQWWLPAGRSPEVVMPFKHLTKRRIVAEYLAAGLDGTDLATRSFSCYHPQGLRDLECGRCKPCKRKWVALILNGITPPFDASEAVEDETLAAFEGQEWARGGDEHLDNVEALDRYFGDAAS